MCWISQMVSTSTKIANLRWRPSGSVQPSLYHTGDTEQVEALNKGEIGQTHSDCNLGKERQRATGTSRSQILISAPLSRPGPVRAWHSVLHTHTPLTYLSVRPARIESHPQQISARRTSESVLSHWQDAVTWMPNVPAPLR